MGSDGGMEREWKWNWKLCTSWADQTRADRWAGFAFAAAHRRVRVFFGMNRKEGPNVRTSLRVGGLAASRRIRQTCAAPSGRSCHG